MPIDWKNVFVVTRGLLYRGAFPYILLLLGSKLSFIIPGTWLDRCSLHRLSTVIDYEVVSLQFSQDGLSYNILISLCFRFRLVPFSV